MIFPYYNFFVERRSDVQTKKYLVYKEEGFPNVHILYRRSKAHLTYFCSVGNVLPHENFSLSEPGLFPM